MKSMERLLVASAIVLVSVASGSGAGASPPETFTEHAHGLVESFVDVFPSCDDGALYNVTTITNLVVHVTIFDDGREHFTFTQTGTFEATPLDDPSLPDATGRFTVWAGFNANGATTNGTFTFSVRGTTEDGERINFHLTEHFNERPDGSVNEFFRCHD
ncbi:MAG TPA: hypothetical protein VMM60_09030 [Ilumatobacter sp.]|nr:hypothetical protein [Ilumatobacter sp.]